MHLTRHRAVEVRGEAVDALWKAPAVPTPRQVLYLAPRARRELINGVPEVRDPFED